MSVSHPQRSRVNQATPKMKEDMDDLLHFVKKLEQTENRNPNTTVFQTPSNKQQVPDDVAESPSVVVNINPSEYLERINRRKMILQKACPRQHNFESASKEEGFGNTKKKI